MMSILDMRERKVETVQRNTVFDGDSTLVLKQRFRWCKVRHLRDKESVQFLPDSPLIFCPAEDEMRALQKRLEETEEQMTRILQAMQTMQSRVTTAGAAGEVPNVQAMEDKAETVGATAASGNQETADKVGKC